MRYIIAGLLLMTTAVFSQTIDRDSIQKIIDTMMIRLKELHTKDKMDPKEFIEFCQIACDIKDLNTQLETK